MATSAPQGMEWQSYFDNFKSVRDVISGKESSTAGVLLGHAINALSGGDSEIGNQMGGNKPIFGAPTAPQGSVPSPITTPAMNAPMTPAPIAPFVANQPQQSATQINGQPMLTQPQFGTNIQQQPATQTPSYSRFLFSPQ